MSTRPVFLLAALAATGCLSGCDTISEMTSWLPSPTSQTFDVTQEQPSLEIQFHGTALKDSKVDEGGNEIALRLDEKADAAEFASVQRRVPDWILGTHTDGDTANIVGRNAASFSAEPNPDGFTLKVSKREAAAADPAAADIVDASAEDPSDGMQREDMDMPFGVAEAPPPEEPPRGSL